MSETRQLGRTAADELLSAAKFELQNGQLKKASATINKVLGEHPHHRGGLYYLAVCERKSNDNAAALSTLNRLTELHPDYGRAYQEEAYNFVALDEIAAAKRALEKAVSLNPALLASWKMLVKFYDAEGEVENATNGLRQVRWLSSLPAQLLTVTSLIHESKFRMAETLCRHYLQNNPHHIEAMRLLAKLGSRLQIFDDAEFLLESCVEFSPDYQPARMDYAEVLRKRQKFDHALKQAEILHSEDPDNLAFEIALANSNQAAGNFAEALTIYERILAQNPNLHRVHLACGHARKTIGHTNDAVASYRAAYRCKIDFGDAYWSLANLKTYAFTEHELMEMQEKEAADSTPSDDKIHFCFALGKAFEDRQDYKESFAYYDRGNHLKRCDSRYQPQRIEKQLETQIQSFDADFFDQRTGVGCSSAAPILIVGLPRAGSTLIEQILASHSRVDGTMELANIVGLAHKLDGRQYLRQAARYPAVLHDLPNERLTKLGEDYILDTDFHRRGGEYFIDKMPNNFRHIALIHLILPNAKIIDARRHPMACCFSGFKQLFAEGQEFSYGLSEIGRYYRAYVNIMNHWDEVLPGRILRVQYENVVANLDEQVRRILDFCELDFEQRCIEYYRTERAVRTPSSEQVRQPIYDSAMEQWRCYAEYLTPLEQALGTALSNYE